MVRDNIQWIFFDIGSTLIDESKAYRNRIEKTVAGTNVSFDVFYNKMVSISKYDQNCYHKALEVYGLAMAPWNSDDEFVYEDAEECLKSLSENYSIGIIANQFPGCKERLKRAGLLRYIDLIVSSAEEGIAKPDLRIFEIALSKAECKAEEAVMVGDRIDNDIFPAKKAGMKTVWIRQGFGGLSCIRSDEEAPDWTVDSLYEVKNLFC